MVLNLFQKQKEKKKKKAARTFDMITTQCDFSDIKRYQTEFIHLITF
jgi:hypothetical protein